MQNVLSCGLNSQRCEPAVHVDKIYLSTPASDFSSISAFVRQWPLSEISRKPVARAISRRISTHSGLGSDLRRAFESKVERFRKGYRSEPANCSGSYSWRRRNLRFNLSKTSATLQKMTSMLR